MTFFAQLLPKQIDTGYLVNATPPTILLDRFETLQILFSRTPDQEFCCFYSCEKILSHIPVLTHWKDKNEQPHVGYTLVHIDP